MFISAVTGVTCVGAFIGAIMSGSIADRIGRRKLLLYNAFITIIASVVNIWPNEISFVVGRFVSGLAAGMGSTISPVFITEYSPAEIRGRLCSLVQIQT